MTNGMSQATTTTRVAARVGQRRVQAAERSAGRNPIGDETARPGRLSRRIAADAET